MDSRSWSGSWRSCRSWRGRRRRGRCSSWRCSCGRGGRRRCGWSWTCSWCRRRSSPREREWVHVKVELVQRAIRVRAIAVRVVRPHCVELAGERGQTNVITIVDAVGRVRRVREPAAQAPVRRPSRATVGAEGAEVFRIVIRNHVRPAWTGHAVVIAAIVKAHCHRAACRIERDVGQKLAVRGCVVVHAHGRAPRRAVISRCAHLNIGVVVFVDRLVCVHQVDAVVERPTGRVPYQAGLSVDRASVLRRDEVEATDIGRRNGDARAETARSQTVRVYVGEDRRRTLSTSRVLIGHDDLAAVRARSDGDTPEAASR